MSGDGSTMPPPEAQPLMWGRHRRRQAVPRQGRAAALVVAFATVGALLVVVRRAPENNGGAALRRPATTTSHLAKTPTATCDRVARPWACPAEHVFELELMYVALELNGAQKVGLSFNAKGFQGPTMRVPLDSIVRVDVTNSLPDQGFTLHFHGLHQPGTPYFDGAHGITQQAIPPLGGKMSYQFRASPAGTHWYHSHVGTQLADGAKGMLIVEEKDDPLREYYDDERAIMFYDWLPHLMASEYMVLANVFGNSMVAVNGNVINGDDCCPVGPASGLVNGKPMRHTPDMTASQGYVLDVPVGHTVRLRLCHGGWLEEAVLKIPEHEFLVVAKDGTLTKPVQTKELAIRAAERYDVLLPSVSTARVGDTYPLYFLLTSHEAKLNATLRYVAATEPTRVTEPLEPWSPNAVADRVDACVTGDGFAAMPADAHLRSWTARGAPPPPPGPAAVRIPLVLTLGVYEVGEWHPVEERGLVRSHAPLAKRVQANTFWMINNNSYVDPAVPLYISKGRKGVSTADSFRTLYYDVPGGGAVVDLVVFAGGKPNVKDKHPMHLHGYKFWVLATGRYDFPNIADKAPDRLLALVDDLAEVHDDPLYVDTFPVSTGYFYVLRFVADNPGWWHFHCHLLSHMVQGLQVVLNVGEDDQPEPPPMWYDGQTLFGDLCGTGDLSR
mmetsp:Transcript_771/g.3052  ORF Transcript_771/g.3052 Transcript_771/m.3052 type:complete len:669 (+) Transcript_771:59-2065(+)